MVLSCTTIILDARQRKYNKERPLTWRFWAALGRRRFCRVCREQLWSAKCAIRIRRGCTIKSITQISTLFSNLRRPPSSIFLWMSIIIFKINVHFFIRDYYIV